MPFLGFDVECLICFFIFGRFARRGSKKTFKGRRFLFGGSFLGKMAGFHLSGFLFFWKSLLAQGVGNLITLLQGGDH